MAKDELIDVRQIADLAGVKYSYLSIHFTKLPDFPMFVAKRRCVKLYSKAAVEKWLNDHDMVECMREANRKLQSPNADRVKPETATVSNPADLVRKFLRGAYLGTSQRRQLEMKKLVARNYSKGITQRMAVVSDWHD